MANPEVTLGEVLEVVEQKPSSVFILKAGENRLKEQGFFDMVKSLSRHLSKTDSVLLVVPPDVSLERLSDEELTQAGLQKISK